MRCVRRLAAVIGASALIFAASVSRAAWVETRVTAHTATVDVERDGSATIKHEILLGVRGGPLSSFEVSGIDVDAEPSGEATVVPIVRYGVPKPIPLVVSTRDDGSLRIEIDHEKGLRTGSYAFQVQYKTQLLARDKIRRRGASAEIEWVGPRFADGIDVAKVIFRLPPGPVAPVLPSGLEGDDAMLMGSAFLSSIRHEPGKVEVEIVRPHVARGEPAVWRVLTSPKCFDGLQSPVLPASAPSGRLVSVERPQDRLRWTFAALGVAFSYGLLVLLKGTLYGRACRAHAAEPRAFVPLPSGARAAFAGALLSSAVLIGALGEQPTLAAALLLLAMAFAALRAPRARLSPRGPGTWLPLKDSDAFANAALRIPGRYLDAGTLPGALSAALVLCALVTSSALIAPYSAYHALSLGLAGTALLPVFGTGRLCSLPVDRARAPRKFLSRLAQRLRQCTGYKVVAWARIPDGSSDADELRLLVRSPRTKDGLLGIEIGVEHVASPAGFVALPFVIVRAREDSDSHRALPRTIVWQRGRRSDERIAILRPRLPTRQLCVALVRDVMTQLSVPEASKSKKTRGASSLTAKAFVRSPAHAT